MSDPKHNRSRSFGTQAAAYERGRPSYPPEAIDWMLAGSNARDVLDLAAGTGKLTARLVERGLNVVAVDPIPEMLEVLRDALPDTPALLGTAEQIRCRTPPSTPYWWLRPGIGSTSTGPSRRSRGCCGRTGRWASFGTSATKDWAG